MEWIVNKDGYTETMVCPECGGTKFEVIYDPKCVHYTFFFACCSASNDVRLELEHKENGV